MVTVKVAEDAPDGTEIDAGTIAAGLLLTKLTVAPLVPAGLPNVTVPVEFYPPATEEGARVTLSKPAGLIVNVVVFELDP